VKATGFWSDSFQDGCPDLVFRQAHQHRGDFRLPSDIVS
jgi:hypothetical protein